MKNYLNLPARKPRTKRDRIEYLKNHFGYGINAAFGAGEVRFAHNVKIPHLPLDYETEDACFAQLENPFAWQMVVQPVLDAFAEEHKGWDIWPEGRSYGYLTLSRNPDWSIDRSEDYADWSGQEVAELFDVVWDFDQACQEAVAQFVDYATYKEPA